MFEKTYLAMLVVQLKSLINDIWVLKSRVLNIKRSVYRTGFTKPYLMKIGYWNTIIPNWTT